MGKGKSPERILKELNDAANLNEKPKYNLGVFVGALPKYDSPERLWDRAEQYMVIVTDARNNIKATISGLSFWLGFDSRQTMYNYEANGEFGYVIRRLRLFVESCYEARLHTATPSGAMFALKNMGWTDKMEVDMKNNGGKFGSTMSDDELKAEIAKYHNIVSAVESPQTP